MSGDPKDERIRELEDEVRRLSLMLESAPDFITRITLDGKFQYLNRLAPGYRMSDVIGTSVDAYVPPEFRQRAWQAMQRARETGSVQQYATMGSTGPDQVGHYLTRISPIVENGEVTSLVLVATDVTALEENRLLLQVALDATALGIWTHTPAGNGSWDETTRKIFGVVDPVEANSVPHLAKLLAERIHPDDHDIVREGLKIAEGTDRYGPIEHRIIRPDGEVRWVAASGITVRDHKGDVVRVVGSIQDITHRRLLEARLLEAQKLESIGRLAGGVAHDFNNMLTAILGNVDLASDAASLDEVRQLLAEVRVTAERSAALTAQLLAFARRQVIEPKVIEPNALLRRLNALLRRVLGEHIEVNIELSSSYCVRADASQLEQVILNLVTNARDSMPGGGRLTLQTSDVELDVQQAGPQPEVLPGPHVRILVRDTGAGIPASDLPHVFEPFFTTRQGGTGLGLATCYGIVKQTGGHITVQSELGSGTTFEVFLPRVDAPAPDGPTPLPPSPSPAHGGARVLLAEDEAAVRGVLERALSRAGYQVVVACNGDEAVQLAEERGPFELMITDTVMPGMSGWEVGKKLGARWPELRILYISGYSEDALAHGGVLEPGLRFLQKPFSPGDLLERVRRILDE
jgi:PAS domain S-box-containing protein